MRRPPFLPLAIGAALALLAAAFLPSARAEEPDRSRWLAQRTYAKQATFPAPGGASVEAYAPAEGPASEVEGAWFRFLLLENGDVAESFAVDVTRVADQPTRLELFWEDQGPESPGVLVGVARVAEDARWLESVRPLLATALAVRAEWRAASALLAEGAARPDAHARHPLVLTSYRALERLHAAHPAHLGILADLLAADQLLVPLEAGSDRGANLAFAWREHVAAWRAAAAQGADDRLQARTAVVCTLAEGCYAHAAFVLSQIPEGEEAEIEAFRAGIRALGQESQEFFGTHEPEGPKGALRVEVLRCTAEPPAGTLFHRLTFLAAPRSRPESSPVWYSLTCERTEARTRWALYGWVGGSRRLLHLYGAEEPSNETVVEEVVALAHQAVGAEAPK
jgi:hypothetical protein